MFFYTDEIDECALNATMGSVEADSAEHSELNAEQPINKTNDCLENRLADVADEQQSCSVSDTEPADASGAVTVADESRNDRNIASADADNSKGAVDPMSCSPNDSVSVQQSNGKEALLPYLLGRIIVSVLRIFHKYFAFFPHFR